MKTDFIYRQLAAFLFFAAFFAQTFSGTFVIADYYVNTAKYAKNCVNKATPKLHCNGQCQMMKKLKQEEKQDEENPERKAENKNEVSLCSKSFFADINIPAIEKTNSKKLISYTDGNSIDRCYDIFHPPKLT